MESETLTTIDDPDFGSLDLVRMRFRAKSRGDADWQERSLLEWQGRQILPSGLACKISVYVDSDEIPAVPDVPEIARASFRKLIADEEAFRRNIAEREIGLAVDWASEGEDIPRPTVESFANALRLTDVQFDPGRITFWYAEELGIFGGHAVEVRLDLDGQIKEITLAG